MKSTAMDTTKYDNLITAIKEKAAEILPAGSRLSLYGSRARGDAGIDSDWDLHILIPGDENISLDEIDKYANPFEHLGWEYNEFITPRVYSINGWIKRSFLPFYKNVEHDKIILFQN